MPDSDITAPSHPLTAIWRPGLCLINLRGVGDDANFVAGVAQALGLALPRALCSTQADGADIQRPHRLGLGLGLDAAAGAVERIVWVGPDEWFVIATAGQAGGIEQALRAALAGHRHAVTDVSSGYCVLQLSGRPVREVLAQGCPLDLHPRVFGVGRSAGSHFFKTSLWLWQTNEAPRFELLVRRSFIGYVQLMLHRGTRECGLSMNALPTL